MWAYCELPGEPSAPYSMSPNSVELICISLYECTERRLFVTVRMVYTECNKNIDQRYALTRNLRAASRVFRAHRNGDRS